MQQFLARLERVGEYLVLDGGENGLWPWIVAGVTAAAACEFARRQWKRPNRGPDLAGDWFPGLPTNTSSG
jgi:hypothetical protein